MDVVVGSHVRKTDFHTARVHHAERSTILALRLIGLSCDRGQRANYPHSADRAEHHNMFLTATVALSCRGRIHGSAHGVGSRSPANRCTVWLSCTE